MFTVLIATILHSIWGILLMGWPESAGVTGVWFVYKLFNYNVALTGCAFLMSAISSAYALIHHPRPGPLNILFLLPQQIVLLISAIGACWAIYLGTYADGVVRPHTFLAVDQAPIILLAVGRVFSLINFYWGGPWLLKR